MKRAAAVLTALALSGSLSACGDDGSDALTPSAATSSPSPAPSSGSSAAPSDEPTSTAPVSSGTSVSSGASASSTASSTASATSTASASSGEDDAPVAFPAGPALSESEPSGGPLSVTAVRVARQDGFDRVVFELAGTAAGRAGWRVEYVDEPSAQGSGDPVAVGGEAALAVLITGTGYPMDTGQEEVAEDPSLPGDLAVVEDVVLGAVFEGQYEAFIGTAGEQPFRVFRLGDPERVVVDVRTP